MIWFKCNPSDLLRRWPHRSLNDFGTYCTLYFLAWDKGGLPDNAADVARISGLKQTKIDKVWDVFRQHCAVHLGLLMPPEMLEGLQRYRDKAEKGRISSEKRWSTAAVENKGLANATPIAEPNGSWNADKNRLDKKRREKKESKSHCADAPAKEPLLKDFAYEEFCRLFVERYESPYINRTADFVQFAKMIKSYESGAKPWEVTQERCLKSLTNYFKSEDVKQHTFADWSARFGRYFKGIYDKYGTEKGSTNGSSNAGTQGIGNTTSLAHTFQCEEI